VLNLLKKNRNEKEPQMKTLVAEDDITSRRIAFALLSRFGPCETVVNGAEAVESFKLAWEAGQPYDLICLDIMMPEMDGQEALKRIRALEREKGIRSHAEVKVIMLTALDDPRSVVEAYYRGGATAYLVKPIESDNLLAWLRRLGLVAGDPRHLSERTRTEQPR
jgi:two-component system, chemotaxis family, chemotaxis protein CheY